MEGIPGRVLSLIESSGLSRRAFAREIGLDDSKLSKSLSGARRFSSLDLARVAERFGVTVDWLVTGEEPALALAARTTTGDAHTAVDTARRYSVMREDLAAVGWEQPWCPLEFQMPDGPPATQGEALAEAALTRVMDPAMGSGAFLLRAVAELMRVFAELPALVETAFGADVAVVDLDDGFDGLAAASDDARLIVLGTSRVPARQRFTLAHELGHLLAGDDQGVHLDKDVYDRAQAKDPTEQRANAFASAFLMPASVLREAVGAGPVSEEMFAALACDLHVSPSALAIRLERLGLLGAERGAGFRQMTAARAASIAGRNAEFAQRVAYAGSPRPPGLLVRDAYDAYQSGDITIRPYASLLGADADRLSQSLETDERALRV